MMKDDGYTVIETLVGLAIGVVCTLLVVYGIQLIVDQKKSLLDYHQVKEQETQGLYFLKRYLSRSLQMSIDTSANPMGLSNNTNVEGGGIAYFNSNNEQVVANSLANSTDGYYYPIAKFWMEQQQSLDSAGLSLTPVAIYFKGSTYGSRKTNLKHTSGKLIIYIGPKTMESSATLVEFDPLKQSTQTLTIDRIVELSVLPEGYLNTATGVTFRLLLRHFFPTNKVEQWCPSGLIEKMNCANSVFKDVPAWIFIPLKNNYYKPDEVTYVPRAIYFFQPEHF